MFQYGEGWNEVKGMDFCYGDNFTKSFCRQRDRGVWLWLRHCLPTLHFQRRKAVWNVFWRLSRWCNSLRSHPRATTQIELKAATLIRCCHAKVREYLQLTVTDSATYGDIREAILSHDRASKVWSQETVLRSLTQGSSEQKDGPTPMEVDRAYMEKGKRKRKRKERRKR